MNATYRVVDGGFHLGFLPPKEGEIIAIYKDQQFMGYGPPPACHLELGQIVSKGITRPSDIGQKWVVVGLYYNRFSEWGWKATIARVGTKEFHRNSLYIANAATLYPAQARSTKEDA